MTKRSSLTLHLFYFELTAFRFSKEKEGFLFSIFIPWFPYSYYQNSCWALNNYLIKYLLKNGNRKDASIKLYGNQLMNSCYNCQAIMLKIPEKILNQ